MKRGRLALFHLSPPEIADFVRTDIDILSELFNVRPVLYRGAAHGWPDALRIATAVQTSDANVSWFAYHQAYLAVKLSRILRKPSVVIVGGFDVASEERPGSAIPEQDRIRLRVTLEGASAVLAVSNRLADLASQFVDRKKVRVVPLGFDPSVFSPNGPKDGSVVTVAYIRRDYLVRKGLMSFVRAAHDLPDIRFLLVGKGLDDSIRDLQREAPENVTFTGWLDTPVLIETLRRASVYVQASTHEGFGSAVAQAMLCECVPVVTRSGALPEVVGDRGVYVEASDPHGLADGIRRALRDPLLGTRSRERIANSFSLRQRRETLLDLFRDLTT